MKGYRLFSCALFLSLLFAIGCEKDDETSGFLIVETSGVTDVSANGATFNGRITDGGVKPILDHGFVWSPNQEFSIENGDRTSLGTASGKISFSHKVDYALQAGTTYYFKAYSTNEDNTVYGEAVSFVSKGGKDPIFQKLEPQEATWYEGVKIVGLNFSTIRENLKVQMNSLSASIVANDTTSITALVPPYILGDSAIITVEMNGTKFTLKQKLSLTKPVIESITPVDPFIGDVVTIHGKNFVPTAEITDVHRNTVEVNGYQYEITSSTKTEINLKLDINFSPAKVPLLSVSVYGQTDTTSLRLHAPIISTVSPLTGNLYTEIEVAGNYFHPGKSYDIAKVGESVYSADVNSSGITEAERSYLKINQSYTDYGLTRSISREREVSVTVAGRTTTASQKFLVTDPFMKIDNVVLPLFGGSAWINSYFFVLGGPAQSGYPRPPNTLNNLFYAWNADQRTWSPLANLPIATYNTYNPSVFAVNGQVYAGALLVGAGMTSSRGQKFWRYTPISNSWSSIADFPNPLTAASPYIFVVGSRVFCLLSETATDNFWEYIPSSDQWVMLNDLPFIAKWTTGFESGGTMYISFDAGSAQELWQFSPGTGLWAKKKNSPTQFGSSVSGFELNNAGYVAFGDGLAKYDLSGDTWQIFPNTRPYNAGPVRNSAANVNGTVMGFGSFGIIAFDPAYEQY
jgi:hypothetical protein